MNFCTDVGPAQYLRLAQAAEFYGNRGYIYKNVPWAVDGIALNITKPSWIPLDECPHFKGKYVVASAEQSFLQLQMEHKGEHGDRDLGRYVTMTPCFRSETEYNELHRPYFLKVELIDWRYFGPKDLHEMISLAEEFFSSQTSITLDVVETDLNDPLRVPGTRTFDIVTRRGRVELGSYGIRFHEHVGHWLYGTGCAEPRLTYAIEKENSLA
jgi:hypothetical protein